ncbi:hypothetical protein Tco_0545056 [Tanacetum coccineum]
MSDNIPLDIQIKIIKKVRGVKSLVRFRSVLKPWKWFISLVEDDNETFKVQQKEFAPFVMSPLVKQYYFSFVVGACHGLLCMYGFHDGYNQPLLVIWNPSIGKLFGIAVPVDFTQTVYGFGVCPVTKDPTVVKIIQTHNKPWHVEVFTLSSRVWNVIPSSKLPHESIILDQKTHVVIDKLIYWGASEKTIRLCLSVILYD